MKELVYDILGISLVILIIVNVFIPQINTINKIGNEIEIQQQALLTAIK